ncbi:uncharacterized protein EI90DRAFT_3121437 [Cantharellus anzutake]|uniref:uncharacterized protein n=1 Tax=Cantharellus anzutake TaxID=1750568 RepID=UPI00190542BC|nr:uncharacterized protein EI90DRAFT_3121437 [Cantharellus anzutake]KAF8334082.1 hypothetical protein EI90DRAFT_3121437 [Cantharellus anzutake]
MDAFQVKIPSLPIFYTPGQTGNLAGYRQQKIFSRPHPNETYSPATSIPSRGRPKRKAAEDQDSPVKKICENSGRTAVIANQRAEFIGSPPEPLSPSKRLNREDQARSCNAFNTIESEWMASSSSQTPTECDKWQSTSRCPSCYSSAPEQLYLLGSQPRPKPLATVELILSILRSRDITLGEFLITLFGDTTHLSTSAKEMLKWFIGGRTVKNHPVDIVHALYSHPWARPQQSYEPTYDTLPEYAIPMMSSQPGTHSDIKNTYSKLQEYFIARVVDRLETEVRALLKSPYLRARDTATSRFSWDTVLDFSVNTVQKMALSVAPVTWMLLTWIAVGGERAEQLKEAKLRDSGKGRGLNHVRDPYLGCTVVLMVLLYFRNKGLNKFQSIMGLLMFSENSSKSLQSITGRIGLAVANSSTLQRLYSMSAVASEKIRNIGANWVNKLASFHVVYDNINQYHKDWRPSLSSQTCMESGTAATLIMQPGVAADAFDGFEYEERRRHVKRDDITLTRIWDDVDRKHLENVCVINILY